MNPISITKTKGNTSSGAMGAGVEEIKFNVPAGSKYSHFAIGPGSTNGWFTTFNVVKSPASGATGLITFQVLWTHPPFTRVSFKLIAFGLKINDPVVNQKRIVRFGSNNWHSLCIQFIDQKLPFSIEIVGPDALRIFQLIRPLNNNARGVIGNELVTVTLIICITLLGLAGLGVFSAVLLYGINNKCDIDADLGQDSDFSGGSSNQKIVFIFRKCGGN